jgi:hypothetical protein
MSDPSFPSVSFQTIRLAPGKHASPAEGACVMELASMLAGEPFTDRPASVSPAIAAFLRAYNDSVDDGRRQELYGLASTAIGTRSTPSVEQQRIARWSEWAQRRYRQRALPVRMLWRLRYGCRVPLDTDAAAFRAVASIGRSSDESHAQVLALIQELCEIGSEPAAAPPSHSVGPLPSVRAG